LRHITDLNVEARMAKVRMNIEVSKDIADLLESLADEEDTTKTEIVRRALSVLKAYKQQKARGRSHIGFTSDPERLDAELIGILDR
jgi:Ribbon-helix-helix protein, copG family